MHWKNEIVVWCNDTYDCMFDTEPLLISTGEDGQPSSTMKWRGISSADTGKKEAFNISEDGGLYGAEWTELRWSSARSMQFTEEDLWYRIGCVTKEGVLIEGHA